MVDIKPLDLTFQNDIYSKCYKTLSLIDAGCLSNTKHNEILMNMSLSSRFVAPVLVGAALLGVTPASATELSVGQATVTQLSPKASAVTYLVDRPDGYHVIVTVTTEHNAGADALHQMPAVRFTSRILPGQTINLSLPEAFETKNTVVEITRRAEHVAVETRHPTLLTD